MHDYILRLMKVKEQRSARNESRVISALGWLGAVSTLAAYTLNSHQLIQSHSHIYLIMNGVASGFLLIYTFRKGAYANTAVNVVWLTVSMHAFLSGYLK